MSQPHTSRPAQARRAAAPAPRAGTPSTADFSRPGAIDLSQFASASAGAAPAGPASPGDYSVEVSEQELNDVIQQSLNYPVILALLSPTDPGCQRVKATLSSLSDRANGRWLLATVDVDAQPRIAQALRVSAIPTVMALLAGQAMPLFQGTADEQQISGVIDQVLASAVANGVAGRVAPRKHADSGPDPRFAAADDAMHRGDYATARDEFEKLVKANPKDTEAVAGRATAALLVRSADADVTALVAASDAHPEDVDKALAAADAQLVVGQAQQGLERLIRLIRTTAGDEREKLRQRVLELFETLDPADPTLLSARRALGAALY
ncbi:putative thioredoxin [Propionibacterium cyclohexanicum]|uniref:Putative thioredoxin n=1 Tax=Propionibacterium cyclohexanicum TaxID=64702 RepID=A0A1H9R329_9ACTN|nr:tetratricopeptide repeat protein [Propionibacterium cyclohexanicum]SER66459.1 putative thioredoxin [Propionibacterium cyclohexanicum]